MCEAHTQHPQKVNVWADIVEDRIIGSFFFYERLKGQNYRFLIKIYTRSYRHFDMRVTLSVKCVVSHIDVAFIVNAMKLINSYIVCHMEQPLNILGTSDDLINGIALNTLLFITLIISKKYQ